MKRIASLLMLAARSTLWKAAGITLASCLTEAGLFLAALSGWQDTVRTAYYEYSNPMGLEGLLMQYPLSWCFRIGLVLRVYRRSALTTLTILIGSIGVFVFGMEFFVDRWLHQLWSPSWSLVVLTICIGMVIPLIIIRRVPALREEARRRFHL